ncbi:hypothetical protein FOC4_g10005714 [Fusarium odoratissimum]|uniref:Uncharacterized protein n=1 Tax=Fusarium oxysporum f. sp. cubense (strain race 4) TaxID=2502994 RepID=N1RPT8_FUSC4|nr:hypothetical protein FOC4_g10005714 [Fusarium odoratissimum]
MLKPNSTRMMLKATHHCYILLYYRVTSNAWDRILELLALSHQSDPAHGPLLANTSASVITFKVVRKLQ